MGNFGGDEDERACGSLEDLVSHMKLENAFKHIKGFGTFVPMGWRHSAAWWHLAFQEAERATCVLAKRLERDGAAAR